MFRTLASALMLVALSPMVASAQLWDPLDVLPRPNAIVGIDSSVTMGITADCTNCHVSNDRLSMVKSSLLTAMPLFEDEFIFGGFEYSGCGYAKIENRAVPPDPNDPSGSYARVQALISNADSCDSRERYFENMGQPEPTGCATSGCTQDLLVAQQLADGDLEGFDPFAPWRIKHCLGPTNLPADVGDPCAWWPPKPPLYQPPRPVEQCWCDSQCHHGENGTMFWVWEQCSSCSTSDDCPFAQSPPGTQLSNRVDCNGGWCPPPYRPNSTCQSDGWVKKWIDESQLEPATCLGPWPPMVDLYPDWGVPNSPMEWPPAPDIPYVLPLYPEYVNAPACDADPDGGGESWCVNHAVKCAAGNVVYPFDELVAMVAAYKAWPRWYQRTLTAQDVEDEFCQPLRTMVGAVRASMMACGGGSMVVYPDPTRPDFCDAAKIASVACLPGLPFYGTCVCDDSAGECSNLFAQDSACGQPLSFKARQQVAVCEAYNPSELGAYFSNQADNRSSGGCRENFGMFFTDGYMGDTAGVATEAAAAIPFYSSVSGASNLFVFRVSDVFTNGADAMMSAFGQATSAFDATDSGKIEGSMARILNRAYQGVYTGAGPGHDLFTSRLAVHAFTVPGDPLGTPNDEYLGWPARVSWYAIEHNGTVGRLIFDTDQRDKVQGSSACGPVNLGGTDVPRLGPGGTFRNGVARDVIVPANSIDRNGDGSPDAHPELAWGKMFSIGATRPIVVEGPRDASIRGAAYADYDVASKRPRMIYVMSNGYVHGFHGGSFMSSPAMYGNQKMLYTYDDSTSESGVEVLRYRPDWLEDPRGRYRYAENDLVQQPIINGQLVAREVAMPNGSGYEMRTILVGAQGPAGPGYFALDITDPCATSELASWKLPGATDSASGEPTIGTVVNSSSVRVPVSFSTGGLGGTSSLYAVELSTGNILYQTGLPPSTSYPTSPVCVDVTGEGRTTHCYVLSEEGLLVRVPVGPTGFGAPVSITPAGVQGGGRRFGASPVGFFGLNGEVNLIFGSGDFEHLDQADATNYLFKVVDNATRKVGLPNTAADLSQSCGATSNGQIALGAGERIITRPVVSDEVIAWTTFSSGGAMCAAGQTRLYAIDFETCADLIADTGAKPASGVDLGDGLPTSPILHTQSQSLITGTSAAPSGDSMESIRVAMPNARPVLRKVFRRPWIDAR
ncbi:MAG: hypothetical protein IPK13_03515 [Deltaproteobacteria bacterium]|nr:hypothetical protein [Deltaproteobacteria bacterium]